MKGMLKSIFCFLIIPCLFIALFLHSFGVEQVAFDDTYYRFFSRVLQIQNAWSIAIPNIPPIPEIGNGFLDVLIGFINGLTSFINIIILLVNVVISVLQFVLSLVKAIIDNITDLFHNSNIVINTSQLCHI